MLYQEKTLDINVGIICVDGDFSKIEKTKKSTSFLGKDYKCIAVIPDAREKEACSIEVFKGGSCITSMMDVAIKNCVSEWVYIVFAGSIVKKSIDVKLSRYVEGRNDVLFPVVDRIYNWIYGSLNGILINRNFYTEVGEFGSGNSIQDTKILWADRALEKGVRFKAIVNACNY